MPPRPRAARSARRAAGVALLGDAGCAPSDAARTPAPRGAGAAAGELGCADVHIAPSPPANLSLSSTRVLRPLTEVLRSRTAALNSLPCALVLPPQLFCGRRPSHARRFARSQRRLARALAGGTHGAPPLALPGPFSPDGGRRRRPSGSGTVRVLVPLSGLASIAPVCVPACVPAPRICQSPPTSGRATASTRKSVGRQRGARGRVAPCRDAPGCVHNGVRYCRARSGWTDHGNRAGSLTRPRPPAHTLHGQDPPPSDPVPARHARADARYADAKKRIARAHVHPRAAEAPDILNARGARVPRRRAVRGPQIADSRFVSPLIPRPLRRPRHLASPRRTRKIQGPPISPLCRSRRRAGGSRRQLPRACAVGPCAIFRVLNATSSTTGRPCCIIDPRVKSGTPRRSPHPHLRASGRDVGGRAAGVSRANAWPRAGPRGSVGAKRRTGCARTTAAIDPVCPSLRHSVQR